MRGLVAYIHDPIRHWPLTSRSNFYVNLCWLWHWHAIFGTWVYQFERMCLLHLWILIGHWSLTSMSNLWGLWHGFLFESQIFFLSHSHTMWMYHHGTMCRVHPWTLYVLGLRSPYQILFSECIWGVQDGFCLCSST